MAGKGKGIQISAQEIPIIRTIARAHALSKTEGMVAASRLFEDLSTQASRFQPWCKQQYAAALIDKGEPGQAEKLLQDLVTHQFELRQKASSQQTAGTFKAYNLNNQAYAANESGSTDKALQLIEEAGTAFETEQDIFNFGRLLVLQGKVMIAMNQAQQADEISQLGELLVAVFGTTVIQAPAPVQAMVSAGVTV